MVGSPGISGPHFVEAERGKEEVVASAKTVLPETLAGDLTSG
jgi:hypothetical protein